MQLAHKHKHQWTKNEKEVALTLYYKSPSLYLFMKENLKFNLPSKSTITYWLRVYQLPTGTNTVFFKNLKSKVNTMTAQEKECVLLMDEMSLKKGLEYNTRRDLIEGFQDMGNLGRESQIATQALVFMVRGLCENWKIPVSYYLSASSIKHQYLEALVKENITCLQNAGLNIRALVCDQGASNRAAIKILGVTLSNPYFYVNHKKIFTIYDVPHLVKSIRNNLIARDIYIGEKTVSWEDVRAVYQIDKKSNTARAIPKISEQHITPNTFQKMRVKYATQIFSRTVSAAINTCVATKQIKSNSAKSTSEFLFRLNNIFDTLNSSVLNHSNQYRCALSINKSQPEMYLREALEWISTWRSYKEGKRKERNHCFLGLKQSIYSVLLLWEDLKRDGYKFLLTRRLHQDPLENFFSIIRRRSGNNVNPTAKSFRQSVQWNMLMKLLQKADHSNCEEDEDEILEIESVTAEMECNDADVDTAIVGSKRSSSIQLEDVCESNNVVKLEECATVYFAGYVVHKVLNKFQCDQCLEFCTVLDNGLDDKRELFYWKRIAQTSKMFNI